MNPHKPKRLTGLHQKVGGQSRGFLPSPGADTKTTGGQARPTSFMGMYAERGNPGVSQGTPTGVRAQEDGESECRSAIERIEVEPTTATWPRAKACRLPSGLSGRERLINRQRKQADDGKHTCSNRDGGWCGFPRERRVAYHRLACGSQKRASAPSPYRRAPVTGHQFQQSPRLYPLWERGLLSALPQSRKTASGPEHGMRRENEGSQSNLDTVKARLP